MKAIGDKKSEKLFSDFLIIRLKKKDNWKFM